MLEFKPDDKVNNRYAIVRKLGAGAMGSVYLAHDRVEHDIKVALKVLVSDMVEDQDIWAKGEYEALTRLRHPNLARVYDFGKIQGTNDYFIVSEFIKGTDLFAGTEYSNYNELCDIIVQVCRSLEYIHSQGYVHFDIKPENILLTRHKSATLKEGSKVMWSEESTGEGGDGEGGGGEDGSFAYQKPNVKLIDFGLAEKITGSFDFAIKGTLNYLAPEMIDGGKPDQRADLYSLGVTLYQITNRDLPFCHDMNTAGRALKRSELFEMHMKKLPEFLREVIMRLLAERPENRFQSAKEVIEAISEGSGTKYELETPETRSSYLHTTALIGRQEEMEQLKEFARSVFPQLQNRVEETIVGKLRPPLVLVSGEIGSGKSRLLEEFRHFLRLNYVQVYGGNCYEGQNKAYQPFVELLRQLTVYMGKDHDLFQRYKDVLLRLLPEFRTSEDVPTPLGLRPDQEKLYFIDRIVHFMLEAARDQPFLLLLNNLHWADEMTVELLGYFLQNLMEEDSMSPNDPVNVLVVGTLRTDGKIPTCLRDLISQMREEECACEMALKRFKRDKVKGLISAMLHMTDISGEFIDCVYNKTGGNPLFVVEILKSLQETGAIKSGDSGWQLAIGGSWGDINLPTNVELALLSRLENLESLGRSIIEMLALINRPVTPKLLEQVPRLAQAPVLSHLNELREKGFIVGYTEDGEQYYSIDQPSFAQTIYRHLDEEKRCKGHREFADLLKETFSSREDEVLEELVYHYRNSDAPDEALALSLRAGERLKSIYANEKAYEYFAYAAEVLEDREMFDRQWLYCQESMGGLCFLLGRYHEAENIYLMLLDEEKGVRLSEVEQSRYHRCRGKILEVQGDYDRALQSYKEARCLLFDDEEDHAKKRRPGKREVDENELNQEKIWLTSALGGLYVRMGKYEKAMKISINALKTIESSTETIEHAVVFSTIGRANYFKGNLPQAIEFHKRSLEIQEKLENFPEIVMTLNSLGESYQADAKYCEAWKYFQRAMDLSDEMGDSYGRALSFHSLGWFYLAVGELDKAMVAEEKSLKLTRNFKMRQLSHYNYILQGLILQEQKEYSKAEGCLFRALTALSKQGNRWELCRLLTRMGALHLLKGNMEEADRMVRDACRLSDDLGISRLNYGCLIEKGKMFYRKERFREALQVYRSAIDFIAGDSNKQLAAHIYYVMAEVLLQLHRSDEALNYFKRVNENAMALLDDVPERFKKSYREKHANWYKDMPDEPQDMALEQEGPAQQDAPKKQGSSFRVRRDDGRLLALVTKLTGELASSQSPQQCLSHAIIEMTRHLNAQYGFLLRIEGDEDVRIILAYDGEGQALKQPSSRIVGELVIQVLTQCSPMVCANTFDDKEINGIDQIYDLNLKSVIVSPLFGSDEITGVLYIANPDPTFGCEELKTVTNSFLPIFSLGLNQTIMSRK